MNPIQARYTGSHGRHFPKSWLTAGTILTALFLGVFFIANSPSFAQESQKPMDDGSVMRMSKRSFDETMSALTQAIENQNLMVIHVIDGQKMMRMAGKAIGPMSQVFFFHPRYMRRVWEANSMAGIQIPLKFIIMERPDGKVVVRYLKPSSLLGKYKGVEEIATELDDIVEKIVAVATG